MNGDIFYFTCVHSLKRGTELLPVEVNRLFEANFQWYFQYCKTFTKSEREGNLSCMWHYILVHVPSCYKGYGWKKKGTMQYLSICNQRYEYIINKDKILRYGHRKLNGSMGTSPRFTYRNISWDGKLYNSGTRCRPLHY